MLAFCYCPYSNRILAFCYCPFSNQILGICYRPFFKPNTRFLLVSLFQTEYSLFVSIPSTNRILAFCYCPFFNRILLLPSLYLIEYSLSLPVPFSNRILVINSDPYRHHQCITCTKRFFWDSRKIWSNNKLRLSHDGKSHTPPHLLLSITDCSWTNIFFQEFQEVDARIKGGGEETHYSLPKFGQNCMKMKKMGRGREVNFFYVDPPMFVDSGGGGGQGRLTEDSRLHRNLGWGRGKVGKQMNYLVKIRVDHLRSATSKGTFFIVTSPIHCKYFITSVDLWRLERLPPLLPAPAPSSIWISCSS